MRASRIAARYAPEARYPAGAFRVVGVRRNRNATYRIHAPRRHGHR